MTSDLLIDTKTCPRCKQTKPLSDFIGPRAAKPRVYCNPCNSEYVKAWNKDHPERVKAARIAYITSGRYKQTPSYRRQKEQARVAEDTRYVKHHERALARIADELANGKVCKVCGLTKPLDEFASCGKPRFPEYPDLHQKRAQCKECWSRIVLAKQKQERGEPSTPKT